MRRSKLILVVPCYNESRRIPLDLFERFLSRHEDISVCFVDDGSTDSTRERLLAFVMRNDDASCLVSMPKNSGKADAVRFGMLEMLRQEASCPYIGYWDADLATPLEQSVDFLDLLEGDSMILAVMGSRWVHLGATIERQLLRNLIGMLMATIIASYLKLNLHDSQCGAKIFRNAIAHDIFSKRFVSRWLFDVEIFKRLKQFLAQHLMVDEAVMMNMHCREIPLRCWRDIPDSKLHISDALKIFSELIRIAWHYRQGGRWGCTPEATSSPDAEPPKKAPALAEWFRLHQRTGHAMMETIHEPRATEAWFK